ncbi:MAG: TIGR03936 family radical SAM-associated protein [Ruminococcus sp.]|nr:TIGR03936 family radical SAM-associated protein [Ruminococcus sp.]
MKTTVRMKFTKKGRAKYISHLDLMRCFQRCIRRAELPIAYSEGFHPHMQIVFAAALSLGFESDYEVIELGLSEALSFDEVQSRMQAVLPDGIDVISCYEPKHKMGQIAYAEYDIILPCQDSEKLLLQWNEFISQEKIIVEKKTKRGFREMDLKELTECLSEETRENALVLKLRLPAGSTVNVNPALLVEEFRKNEQVLFDFPKYCRKKLLCNEKTEFF